MKYKWYKNLIKYKQELKELELKAKLYEDIRKYLFSCVEIKPNYREYKDGRGQLLARLEEGIEVNYNIDVDKLFEAIGYKTNFGREGNNVNL